MSLDISSLTRPESLSESALLEIIKTRCIEVPDVKKFKKSDLVELFKRVALPLPQRKYNETKYFGKKLSLLRSSRKISTAIEEDKVLYESKICSQNSSNDKVEASNKSESLKRKKLSDNNESISKNKSNNESKSSDKVSDCKRLNLSSSANDNSSQTEADPTNFPEKTNGLLGNCSKRKANDNEVSAQTEVKKRQKITWP